MSDTETETTTAPDTVAKFTLPTLEGERSFDCAQIPANVRLDFLKKATRDYINNRVNAVVQRHQKLEAVIAWDRYDAAVKADALQTAVPKPEGERPAAPDLEDAFKRACEALVTGDVRKQGAEPKARQRKDPLIALVTDTVIREVYESKRAADPKYSFLAAKKEVGTDGIEYLNKMIEAKVAEGVDRAALENMRDTRYINPAKLMLGINDNKAIKALPSIL